MLYPTAFFTNNHVSLHIYKNKLPMKILYYIYQICIALPILLVLTILTAIVTIVGSLLGGAHFWGVLSGQNMVTTHLSFSVDSCKDSRS